MGEEEATRNQTRERRKLGKNELKPFTDGLSHRDSRIRRYALSQLSSMVYTTEIEEQRLLPKLVRLIQDSDTEVRRSAFELYEKLNHWLPPHYKAKFNKRILPLASSVAIGEMNGDIRRQAISALVATGDKKVTKIIIAMIRKLPDEEYKAAIPDHVWDNITYLGLGPTFRKELFKEFVANDSDVVRRRIEEITHGHNLG